MDIQQVSDPDMSTRAQIGFYASEHDPIDMTGTVYIYQHSDGYPEGVLPVLEPFARSFHKRRGLDDTAYATARCLVALAQRLGPAGEEPEYLGLGATTTLYPGIEFFYHVSPTRIGVYAVSGIGNPHPEFRLTDTVALTPAPASYTLAASGEAL